MKDEKVVTVKEYLEKENIGISSLVHRIKQGLEVFINPDSFSKKKSGRKPKK